MSTEVVIDEIKNTDVYIKWQQKRTVNNYDFIAFLKAAPYTSKELLLKHFSRLKESAEEVKDKDVMSFLDWLEDKFGSLMK